jgi:hypothetical protein
MMHPARWMHFWIVEGSPVNGAPAMGLQAATPIAGSAFNVIGDRKENR